MTGGRAVLVTRPQPGADATAARLRALGHVPIVAPMLTVHPLPASLPAPDRLQAVLITSANALSGLPRALQGCTLLAVGAATAAAAIRAGFTDVHSADADAPALARLAAARCTPQGEPLLVASGQNQGAPLAAALRAHGFVVHHIAVYQAQPATRLPKALHTALANHAIESALFLSAETARICATLIADAGLAATATAITAIAISPSVADALRPLPWRTVRVALTPDQDAMLALLA